MMRLLLCLLIVSSSLHASPKFLYEHDPTLLTTTVRLVIRSGGADDPAKKIGASNLLSDLLLRGTKKRSRSQFQRELETMGGSLYGWATIDQISFGGAVIQENSSSFFDLIEEFVLSPRFSPTEFSKLKKEMVAGIKYVKNVNTRLGGLALRREVFKGTTLEQPVRGSLSSMQRINLSDLKARYKDSFHQNNILVAVASPLKEEEVRARFEKIWKQLPSGEFKPYQPIEVKIPKKPRLVVVHKPKTATGSLLLAQKGIVADNPDRHALRVGNFSFGGEPFVSRLFKIVRAKHGWTYSVRSSYQAMGSLSKQPGLFVVSTTPSIEFTAKALFKIIELWKAYLKEGVNEEELSLAKESSINSYPFNFDSAEKRLSLKVTSELYGIEVLDPRSYERKLNGFKKKNVLDVVNKYHQPDSWIISVVADVNVIKKQLREAQKDIPAADRITVSKVYTPNEVIR